jgi:hypothetical protein
MTKTFDLMQVRQSGISAVEGLFGKAHRNNWDIDRDVDWRVPMKRDDALLGPRWAPGSRTATFKKLSPQARTHFTRRSFSFMLNSLRLGEAVAEDVCFRLGLKTSNMDMRAHAAAQAMDEARHHLGYTRILEMMDEEPEEIDKGTRATFETVLALDNITDLVAWEQFYLESLAMNVLRGVVEHARHPVIKRVFQLNTRDESRHLGFGVLYVEDWLARSTLDEQVAFAARWLGQILTLSFGQQDPTALTRTTRWLFEGGESNSLELATQMMKEQMQVAAQEYEAAASGKRVPQELKSARRAGLLRPEILEALRLAEHPLVKGALAAKDDA